MYRRRITRVLAKASSLLAESAAPLFGWTTTTSDTILKPKKSGKFASLPENSCAICAEDSGGPADVPLSHSTPSPPAHSSQQPSYEPPQYPINTPYTTSCGHTYCYYCLTTRMMQAVEMDEAGWECLRCGDVVKGAKRDEAEVAVFDGSDHWSDSSSSNGSSDQP